MLRDLGAVSGIRDGNVVRYSLTADVTGAIIQNAVAAFDDLKAATTEERRR
ncbi:MAG: hypothetical protein AAB295_03620 [Chloroflexota bacterium]